MSTCIKNFELMFSHKVCENRKYTFTEIHIHRSNDSCDRNKLQFAHKFP